MRWWSPVDARAVSGVLAATILVSASTTAASGQDPTIAEAREEVVGYVIDIPSAEVMSELDRNLKTWDPPADDGDEPNLVGTES